MRIAFSYGLQSPTTVTWDTPVPYQSSSALGSVKPSTNRHARASGAPPSGAHPQVPYGIYPPPVDRSPPPTSSRIFVQMEVDHGTSARWGGRMPLDEATGDAVVTENDNPAFLTMFVAPGRWPGRQPANLPYIRLSVDIAATPLWTMAHDYEVAHVDPLYIANGGHAVDMWEKEQHPVPRTPNYPSHFLDGSKYFYVPVAAPMSIATHRPGSRAPGLIVLDNYKYRLATHCSTLLLSLGEIGGGLGFAPQLHCDYNRERSVSLPAAGQTLINQLRSVNLVTHFAKAFVISPASFQDKQNGEPHLWIGVADWPTITNHPLLSWHSFDIREEVSLRVFPAPGQQIERWALKLVEINIIKHGVLKEKLFAGSRIAVLDTAASLTYLPSDVINKMADGTSRTKVVRHAARARGNDAKYTLRPKDIDKDDLLELGFVDLKGGIGRVLVAPLREALTHRNARDGEGYLLATYPMESKLRNLKHPIIGMNWLRFLWQSYRENLPASAEVLLVPSFSKYKPGHHRAF
ncbi:hypothetical protein BD626DRAFT_497263 [Schizophyllum amplum]|uniref:Aspartic peptidase domain-containing protein n=1 Tax=Schizophyllum amplum TaxID=97359 RepID=A0A550CDX2_9AGAR|nr:hypothetical protein BD626DRAFT_515832 [Auriculariopsis ampla]TRM62998.1 hypothetical protein BD626DRAFT_497263 [Auriculariopsis ampla]